MALPEPTSMTISPGRLIAIARDNAGLDQEQLCERIDMSRSKLSRIENGKRSPTLEELEAIIEATGATGLWSEIGRHLIHLTGLPAHLGQLELNLLPEPTLTAV